MVYLTPALAAGVALSVLSSSVNALPAGHGAPSPSVPVSGPHMARRTALPNSVSGSTLGGGSGGKRLRQAPFMKPARLAKAKRNLIARDDHDHEHVHIHEHYHGHEHHHGHDHDDHHHHHDDEEGGDYDPHHSQHWNEHHGRVEKRSHDKSDHDHSDHHGHKKGSHNHTRSAATDPALDKRHHGNYDHDHSEHWNEHHGRVKSSHHHSRSIVNVQALNLGSLNDKQTIQKCSGNSMHCNQHNNGRKYHDKRAPEQAAAPVVARRSLINVQALNLGSLNREQTIQKCTGSHFHCNQHSKGRKYHDKRAPLDTIKSKMRGSGKHGHGLLGRLSRRRRADKTDPSTLLQARDHDRHHGDHHGHEHDHDHEHVHDHIHEHIHSHDHDHDKRQLAPAGVPGFIQVASPIAHSNIAKSVAGLIFSKDADTNSSDFVLSTSETQSTQFYLVPHDDPSADPDTASASYILRMPILDSSSQQANDYCATFDLKPPSPLSMQPCGDIEGYSQIFGYNSTTGQLEPIYPASSEQPDPLTAAVKIGMAPGSTPPIGFPPTLPTSALSLADSVVPTMTASPSALPSTSLLSALPVPTQTQTAAAPEDPATASTDVPPPSGDDSDSDVPPKVSLYFIPSSAYYAEPGTIDALTSAANFIVSTPTSIVGDAPTALPTPASDAMDPLTITLTTTVTADLPAPTEALDNSATYDTTQNSVIADTPVSSPESGDGSADEYAAETPDAEASS